MRSTSSPCAVSMMMGTADLARTRRRTSNPRIPGNMTSRMISEYAPETERSRPSEPSWTASIWKPWDFRYCPTSSQSSTSSSTIRMRRADKASGLSVWDGRITLLYTLLGPESKVARQEPRSSCEGAVKQPADQPGLRSTETSLSDGKTALRVYNDVQSFIKRMLYFGASPGFPLLSGGQSFSRRILRLILIGIGTWRVCQVLSLAHTPALPAR